MSLHVAAQHLASKGRDGDTELVHMTKGEVKSLQGLALAAGGSLSINPNTGLVEASFLKQLLPTIAGFALTGLTGGIINPLTAGMIVGGFEGVRTGDLGKGLMAGLGAYGGAGLGAGLMGAASNTAAANALGVPASAGATATGAGSQAAKLAAENASMGLTPMESAAQIARSGSYAAGAVPPAATSTMSQGLGLLKTGAQNIIDNPMESGKAAYAAMPKGTLPALGTSMVGALTPEQPAAPGMPEEDPRYRTSPYNYRLASNFSGYVPRQPNPYYVPTGLGYAAGGDIQMMPNGGLAEIQSARDGYGAPMTPDGNIPQMAAGGMTMGQGIAKDTDEDTASLGAYDAAKKRLEKIGKASNVKMASMPKANISKLGEVKMASGGLGGYSDGGRMLKGPGDGMSDDIPAVIGNKQPARLADGEFVVPADVVSHLGNGSTDAGARKLYKMMDKVRVARTGKKKQAPAVKTDKYLPV